MSKHGVKLLTDAYSKGKLKTNEKTTAWYQSLPIEDKQEVLNTYNELAKDRITLREVAALLVEAKP
jgi:hypothetical protein